MVVQFYVRPFGIKQTINIYYWEYMELDIIETEVAMLPLR